MNSAGKLVTRSHPEARKNAGRREFSAYLWVVSLAILAILFLAALVRFALPRPEYVSLGNLASYPPSRSPYLYQDEVAIYLASTGGEMIAFRINAPFPEGCRIRWFDEQNAFVDPCRGTQFTLQGCYSGHGPPGTLKRYPLQIKEDEVWVDTSHTIPEASLVGICPEARN